MHFNSVVARVNVYKAYELIIDSGVNKLVNLRQWEAIFKISLVKAYEVNVDPSLSISLFYQYNIG